MHRFKNILAVYGTTEGSDTVLKHATSLAAKNKARLTLIDVLAPRYTTECELAERRSLLGRLAPSLMQDGIADVSFKVIAGIPFLEISKQVINNDHDLVIVSTRDEGSVNGSGFSSTATHVMRKCPCPVWVVRPDQSQHYARVLACVDPTGHNTDELNIKILELAASIAQMNNAELHICNAWEVEGKDRDTLTSEIQDYQRNEIFKRHEKRHLDAVKQLIEHVPIVNDDHYLHLPRGVPQRALVQLVARQNIDLTVMGTVSRTGIAGLIMGNTAEAVLGAIKTGVFTVKPEQFVSPVALHA